MSDALDHIAAWEAAGLIDHPTADRLRAAGDLIAGHDTPATGAAAATETVATAAPPRSAASAMFGPSVTISEVFAYLGGAFLLAAWSSFMARSEQGGDAGVVLGAMALLAAGVLGAMGLAVRGRSERMSRAAGVAFLLVASYAAVAAAAFGSAAGLEWPLNGVVASAVGLTTAIALRVVHPSVLTQIGVLGWLTALVGSTLSWLQVTLFPEEFAPDTGLPIAAGPDPLILVGATAVWWLVTAVAIALIGLREAQIADRDADPGAGRRAAISRFWAGILAVVGLASAVTRSASFADGEYGRVIEPWIGDLALLVLAAILVERAFRRDATSFIYAAGLGLIIALSDFNLTYLSDTTEAALLFEGLILLAVGFAADRLRRRIGRDGAQPAERLVEASAEPAEAPAEEPRPIEAGPAPSVQG